MTFFLTFETCICGKEMLGFLLFFFLVFINVGKCKPIALMLNELCNEFWGILQLFMSLNLEDSVDVNAFMPWVCWFSRSSINFAHQYLSHPT